MGIKGMYLNIRALGPGAAGASLPLHFEASTFEPTPFEGDLRRQAATDVASGGGRFRVTAVSGGDSAPSQVDLDQLNEALSSLRLTAYTPEPIAAASGNPISGFGLHASVPQGWEGRISRGHVRAGDQTIDVSINEFSGPDPSSFVTGQMPLTIGPEEFVDSQDGAGSETARSFVDAGRQFQLWVALPRSPTAGRSARTRERVSRGLSRRARRLLSGDVSSRPPLRGRTDGRPAPAGRPRSSRTASWRRAGRRRSRTAIRATSFLRTRRSPR